MQSEVQFRGPQFQIVPPFGLRVKVEGANGKQGSGSSVCEIENVFCRKQALVRICWIACSEDLVAFREVGRQPSCQVRADGSARTTRRVEQHRAVADKFKGGDAILVSVVNLRQAPDVVVTNVAVPTGGDSNLIVKGLCIVVPHFLQPIEPEFGFWGK